MAFEAMTDAPRTLDQAGITAPPRLKLPESLVAIVVYLAIGLVPFWSVLPMISHYLFGSEEDFAQSVWFLGWIPHAIVHGLNPFFSNSIFVPTGVNLAQNTASPLLGLIAAPFALVFSPVVIANLLMVLAMPVSATAGFLVLRRWKVWSPAAAIGGLIYGFSPYMVGQGLGHLELMFLPLPPFIALTVASILQRQGSPRRLGIRLGLLMSAQYLIAPEVAATVAILAFVAVAFLAIRDPAHFREMAHRSSGPAAIAVVVAAVLLAYPVWMLMAGPQHVAGRTWPAVNPYHNDLLSFVVPGPLQRVSLGMRALGTHLAANSGATEADGYIGGPILILAGWLAWRSRRRVRMQLAVFLLFVTALLTLGPHLAIDGRMTRFPLPFWLLDHLPLLNDILPSRVNFAMDGCVAAVIALGLDDVRRARNRRHHGLVRQRRWTVWGSATLVGAVLALLVVTQLPVWPSQSPYDLKPAVLLPAAIRQAVPGGDPVAITYPYDTDYMTEAMLWQVESRFAFRLLGGYAYHPDSSVLPDHLLPSLMDPPGLQQFLAGQEGVILYGPPLPITPWLEAATRTALSRYDVRLIIVDRTVEGSGPVMVLLTRVLGPPTHSAGRISMWVDWRG
jgi:hypothetical protein